MLNDVKSSVSHLGNGVNKSFDFKFKIWSVNDIEVFIRESSEHEETQVTNFLVALTDEGGVVTYPSDGLPLEDGQRIVIRRAMTIEQPTDFINANTLRGEAVELALDKTVAMLGQVAEKADRAMMIPEGDTQESYLGTLNSMTTNLEELKAARDTSIQAALAAEQYAQTAHDAADAAASPYVAQARAEYEKAKAEAEKAAASAVEAANAAGGLLDGKIIVSEAEPVNPAEGVIWIKGVAGIYLRSGAKWVDTSAYKPARGVFYFNIPPDLTPSVIGGDINPLNSWTLEANDTYTYARVDAGEGHAFAGVGVIKDEQGASALNKINFVPRYSACAALPDDRFWQIVSIDDVREATPKYYPTALLYMPNGEIEGYAALPAHQGTIHDFASANDDGVLWGATAGYGNAHALMKFTKDAKASAYHLGLTSGGKICALTAMADGGAWAICAEYTTKWDYYAVRVDPNGTIVRIISLPFVTADTAEIAAHPDGDGFYYIGMVINDNCAGVFHINEAGSCTWLKTTPVALSVAPTVSGLTVAHHGIYFQTRDLNWPEVSGGELSVLHRFTLDGTHLSTFRRNSGVVGSTPPSGVGAPQATKDGIYVRLMYDLTNLVGDGKTKCAPCAFIPHESYLRNGENWVVAEGQGDWTALDMTGKWESQSPTSSVVSGYTSTHIASELDLGFQLEYTPHAAPYEFVEWPFD